MVWYNDFFGSFFFVAFFLSWISASLFKAILTAISKKKKFSISDGFSNGGMPSTHSTAVSSICIAIALTQGFSPLFFVSMVLALVVISDAFGVRQNIGKQGDALNEILKGLKKNPVKIVYGHSFFQVVMGVLWGVGVTLAVYFLYF